MDARPAEVPEPLSDAAIDATVDQYRQAAENAADACFDGVELHGASGRLIDQFLHDGTNRRDDEFGGSIERRVSFLVDTVQALKSVWAGARVGVGISPFGRLNDVRDSDAGALFDHVARRLRREEVAHVHVMEPRAGAGVMVPFESGTDGPASALIRSTFGGVIVATGGFDAIDASHALQTGAADAIGFGRAFIVHSDLPARLKRGDRIANADPAELFRDCDGSCEQRPN
jgi:N-ethylmaleimide reductase